MIVKEENTKALDLEWIELFIEAKDMGLPPEEIREFLLHTSNKLRS
ncbi:anti-repressor SinI family protein [Halalkalibacter alkalisediminis]|uniref:Anti-repressor SinI family protein n=1 Tax=Halalkalibacter alkalisediminis TaxID=935616 RepID=A0ABV6NIW1_9BACI|nr:anti-repressor SinI family protein [Halalkalibacter alkalisediminis]